MFKKIFQKKIKEEQFWDWFLEHEAELFYGTDVESDRERIFDGLTDRIKAIDDNLAYEFSPVSKNDLKEFTVSADGIKESFEHVRRLIRLAPEHPHWKFHAFRQAVQGDGLTIKMGDFEIGYKDIFFRFLEENEQLSIELNIRGFDGSGYQQNAVYILLDSLLGEYDTVMEIDFIDWEALDESKVDNFYPLVELRKLISNRKREADNKR